MYGYDSDLLIKKLETVKELFLAFQITKKTTFPSRNSHRRQIVNGEENEAMIKREMRFIDSLRFMSSSLSKISSNLAKDQLVNLKKYYNGNQLSPLLRKGDNRHEYVDSMTKLNETRLPPK